jgi:hypothetical protein|tara:strand:+ start:9630 stop:9896 length:267 start_codon:yes stop_codon:yes gene_type:complete
MRKKNYRGSNTINYGKYDPTNEEIEARLWCLRNNIIIFPETKLNDKWSIEIKINNKKYKSPEKYRRNIIWQKMYEFYTYYYNKRLNED